MPPFPKKKNFLAWQRHLWQFEFCNLSFWFEFVNCGPSPPSSHVSQCNCWWLMNQPISMYQRDPYRPNPSVYIHPTLCLYPQKGTCPVTIARSKRRLKFCKGVRFLAVTGCMCSVYLELRTKAGDSSLYASSCSQHQLKLISLCRIHQDLSHSSSQGLWYRSLSPKPGHYTRGFMPREVLESWEKKNLTRSFGVFWPLNMGGTQVDGFSVEKWRM